MRATILLVHRYVGLTLTVFLVVVGATGSVLAFQREIDRCLNPRLTIVAPRNAPCLDPFVLAERVEAVEPRALVAGIDIEVKPGDTFVVRLDPKSDPKTGKQYDLGYDRIVLDPYDGHELGTRAWKGSLSSAGLIPLVFLLHYSLLCDDVGGYVLGAVALLWTLDCFFGFCLTLPAARDDRRGGVVEDPHRPRSWWKRWSIAWLVKRSRLNYDLHRAGGLWTWGMLLVLAWSSVAFNLGEQVYRPVTKLLLGMNEDRAQIEHRLPVVEPRLDFRQAHTIGARLIAEAAKRHGFSVEREDSLYLDRARGLYSLSVTSSLDHDARDGATRVTFDADSGELVQLVSPATDRAGDRLTRWLRWLHTAAIWGRPMQLVICFMGMMVVTLSATGVIIWLRKRAWARQRGRRLRSESQATLTQPDCN